MGSVWALGAEPHLQPVTLWELWQQPWLIPEVWCWPFSCALGSTGTFPAQRAQGWDFLLGTGRALIPWECEWYSLLLLAGAF